MTFGALALASYVVSSVGVALCIEASRFVEVVWDPATSEKTSSP